LQFKIARVKISRPWLDFGIFEYPNLGVKGVKKDAWADGKLSSNLDFAIIPTSLIIAKDITIENSSMFQEFSDVFSSLKAEAHIEVRVGPFKGKGGFNYANSSRETSEKVEMSSNKLHITGPQIIGFVSHVLPPFPTANSE